MRDRSCSSRALACLLAAFLSSVAMPLAAEAPDLSQMTTDELVRRAYELSKQLMPGLNAQTEDWEALKAENETLREDLRNQQSEQARLQSDLEARSTEAEKSASELSEARAELQRTSESVESSRASWKSSIDDVERQLKEMAMKLRRTELGLKVCGGVAVATTIWALTEALLRKAAR